MKIIAMIPARYGSTRFPGKMLAEIAGKPVIVRTYQAAVKTGLFDQVYVVTDDQRIFDAITSAQGHALMSAKEHETGSDRIAEAVRQIDCDIVVNIQGDEPFTKREPLEKLLKVFDGPDAEKIDLATLMQEITDWKTIEDPNYVKIVCDKDNYALYFSRSPIPYPREKKAGARYFEHIGVYAFRKNSLLNFTSWKMRQNEASEKIECIRYLEYGQHIKVVETDYMGVEIDTPEDLIKANELWSLQNK